MERGDQTSMATDLGLELRSGLGPGFGLHVGLIVDSSVRGAW